MSLLLKQYCSVLKVMLVYFDNVSATYLFDNLIQHQHTKHIEMIIHFLRDKITSGQVHLLHVPSRYQIVEIFNKSLPLPRQLFGDFRLSPNIDKLSFEYRGELD